VVRRLFATACETGRADKDYAAVGEMFLDWAGKK
jgi:hypothetical protein